MVYLFWRWPGEWRDADGTVHTERKAPYESLDAALGQAEYDFGRCQDSDDYASSPVRIESQDGSQTLWTAPIPDGR
ncbi:hypothetical protein Sme01_02770 [Sphaerisporangium melleum]|uniref:Uncharacterized protein n=1 Tax=Sphaerisporangium melleum TaxID=321316 RepID=A0A917VBZ5_9ACTN|nr:hypothetical protein [Sphaerisporangium melleum]GGK61133.1 hypothetical protein GCM10007964_00310 [Sphaerisporangium melleum]GII67801.1 hypothetical protein Sme01_02770 [Sphaerisporangium melleum]